MEQKENKFWTFSKAMGTLAGTVLTGVLAAVSINHFTKTPTYPEVGLTGIISNALTKQPIVDAQVTAATEMSIASMKTDTEGRYSFVLTGTASGTQTVSVDIVAGGFAFYRSDPLTVSTGDNYVAFKLSSTAMPASGGTPGAPAGPFGAPAGPAPAPPSSLERLEPEVLKVLPANFSKPEVAEKLKAK